MWCTRYSKDNFHQLLPPNDSTSKMNQRDQPRACGLSDRSLTEGGVGEGIGTCSMDFTKRVICATRIFCEGEFSAVGLTVQSLFKSSWTIFLVHGSHAPVSFVPFPGRYKFVDQLTRLTSLAIAHDWFLWSEMFRNKMQGRDAERESIIKQMTESLYITHHVLPRKI